MRTGHCLKSTLIAALAVGLVAFGAGCGDDDGANDNNLNNTGDDGAVNNCGNGEVEGLEECDDGTNNSDTQPNACRSDCRLPACGDGVIDDGESCDDGPQNADDVPDACRADCSTPACGDGVVDVVSGENCDDGNQDAGDYCSPTCLVEVCGNGSLDPGEACDDGNITPLDGCSPDCRSDETCGNFYPDFLKGEQCDDGNHMSHDGCSSGCTAEFPVWTKYKEPLGGVTSHAMAYDSARDVIVLFSGSGFCGPFCDVTFEHDGVRWWPVPTANSPPARRRSNLVFDSGRGVIVLFGGEQASLMNDTWEFDGTDWTQVTTANTPTARSMAVMTYDAHRGVVVLFGGLDATGEIGDTWEYDGTNWVERTFATAPAARRRAQMVYDSQRQVVVLVAGKDESTYFQDTWEYNGTAWTQTATTSWYRTSFGMAYDEARHVTVVYSGRSGLSMAGCDQGMCEDTWEYNGSAWTNVTPAAGPGAGAGLRRDHAMAYHPVAGGVVLLGGSDSNDLVLDDTSVWNGTAWTSLSEGQRPTARNRHALVYDSAQQRLIMFGGDEGGTEDVVPADTWLFEEGGWRRKVCAQPGDCPAPRTGHVMVWDEARERVVLFGGGYGSGGSYTLLGDTWEFDGVDWTETTPAGSPPARTTAAMAYDPVRERTVLFGGQDGSDPGSATFGDTWEYDGTTWVQITTTSSPTARANHAMTWDASNQEIVMMGGIDFQLTGLTDTWTYDGTAWIDRTQPVAPPARGSPVLVFDPARNRMVLYGGITLTGYLDDTWEWDGTSWKQVFANPPTARGFAASAYHTGLGMVAVQGGFSGVALDDLYFFQYGSQWPEEVCDSGQDVDNDGDTDCADPDCEGRTCATDMICTGGACVTAP